MNNAPIEVVDMAPSATADEAHGHDGPCSAVVRILEPSPVQVLPPDQPPPTPLAVRTGRLCVLDDEPCGEDPGGNRGRLLCVLFVPRWRTELDRLGVEDPRELRRQPRFVDLLSPQR